MSWEGLLWPFYCSTVQASGFFGQHPSFKYCERFVDYALDFPTVKPDFRPGLLVRKRELRIKVNKKVVPPASQFRNHLLFAIGITKLAIVLKLALLTCFDSAFNVML